jgi:hypothetical protein
LSNLYFSLGDTKVCYRPICSFVLT